jgi:hypothetical protein
MPYWLVISQKHKPKTKQIYDYKNADIDGLIQYITQFDFNSAVFSHPTVAQAELYSNVLTNAFSLFVPCKTVIIRTNDQPCSNSYTRLLLRRKNRNYQFYKRAASDYNNLLNQPNTPPTILTRCLRKKNKAFIKSRDAANESTKANRRVKFAFYNTVNSTMNNYSISPKKKFSILLKLMKNNKFSPTPPLLENNVTINEPQQKSELFNTFFASKSNVQGANDDPPNLQRLVNVPNLDNINTSPLEVGKFIRGLNKSHSSYCGISANFYN